MSFSYDREKYFAYKLFFVIKYFKILIYFLCENCTPSPPIHPPPKSHHPLSQQPPSKSRGPVGGSIPPPSKAGERGGCTLCDPVLNLAHILLSQNIHVVQQWFDIHYWVSGMISKVSVGQSFRIFS